MAILTETTIGIDLYLAIKRDIVLHTNIGTVNVHKIDKGFQGSLHLHGKPVRVDRQSVAYSMGLDNLVAVVVSPTALVRLPLPAKILKVGRRVARSAPFGTGHRDACVGNWW